ncbi:MAG: HAD-IA family hydrolase [Cognaticolwellia sp.]
MRFYRRLLPFQAMSFDLDDTLYSNQPIMLATEKKMVAYFADVLSAAQLTTRPASFDFRFWWQFRQQAIVHRAELKHDVGLLRQESYYLGARSLGLNARQAAEFAEHALAYFVTQRSDFTLPAHTHALLSELKSKMPLVAITNGNVDIDAIGISPYFSHHFHASIEHKAKPDADMFTKTCAALKIRPQQLLHVGDCGKNDVVGAINAGCQTAWLSKYDVGKPLKLLPTLALNNIAQLTRLFT